MFLAKQQITQTHIRDAEFTMTAMGITLTIYVISTIFGFCFTKPSSADIPGRSDALQKRNFGDCRRRIFRGQKSFPFAQPIARKQQRRDLIAVNHVGKIMCSVCTLSE